MMMGLSESLAANKGFSGEHMAQTFLRNWEREISMCVNVSPSTSTFPEGMISYWKFDEGTGTTAFDSVGANDGTIYGASWTTGIVGDALDFDVVDDRIEVPYSPTFQPDGRFSVEAWIYPESNIDNQVIVSNLHIGFYQMYIVSDQIPVISCFTWSILNSQGFLLLATPASRSILWRTFLTIKGLPLNLPVTSVTSLIALTASSRVTRSVGLFILSFTFLTDSTALKNASSFTTILE